MILELAPRTQFLYPEYKKGERTNISGGGAGVGIDITCIIVKMIAFLK